MSEVVGKTIEEKVQEFLGHYEAENVKYAKDNHLDENYVAFTYNAEDYEVFTDGKIFIADNPVLDTKDLQMLFEITVFMKNLKGM